MEISVARTLDEVAAAEQCSRDEPARQLELKEDHVNIVFVGQVMRAKGLDELIEAMALGKPVLATTVGSVSDLVKNEETGLLVPVKDADALASQLGRLVRDPELRDRLGKAAKAHARGDCSIQGNMRGLERLYRDIGRDGS